jgi:protein-L-isoaspartate(D-aspartate) O-methyltransferase
MLLQGMGIDGRAISAIEISLAIRGNKIRNTGAQNESAGFNIQFFDADRKPVGLETIGPWSGTFGWKAVSRVLRVPASTREAIIRIGLNGATGELGLDDVRLTPQLKQSAK